MDFQTGKMGPVHIDPEAKIRKKNRDYSIYNNKMYKFAS
jgi:hypothetical protein